MEGWSPPRRPGRSLILLAANLVGLAVRAMDSNETFHVDFRTSNKRLIARILLKDACYKLGEFQTDMVLLNGNCQTVERRPASLCGNGPREIVLFSFDKIRLCTRVCTQVSPLYRASQTNKNDKYYIDDG